MFFSPSLHTVTKNVAIKNRHIFICYCDWWCPHKMLTFDIDTWMHCPCPSLFIGGGTSSFPLQDQSYLFKEVLWRQLLSYCWIGSPFSYSLEWAIQLRGALSFVSPWGKWFNDHGCKYDRGTQCLHSLSIANNDWWRDSRRRKWMQIKLEFIWHKMSMASFFSSLSERADQYLHRAAL